MIFHEVLDQLVAPYRIADELRTESETAVIVSRVLEIDRAESFWWEPGFARALAHATIDYHYDLAEALSRDPELWRDLERTIRK